MALPRVDERKIPQQLEKVPLLSVLSAEQRAELAQRMRPRRFNTDQTIFMQGDTGDCMYLLLEGTIKVVSETPSGREVTLTLLGPGSFFGDMALLDGEPRSASTYAVEPAQALVLHRSDFFSFLDHTPGAARSLLGFLSQRLRHANARIQDLALLTARQRLAAVLIDLAKRQGTSVEDGILLPRSVSHRVLAGLLGTTRETITRMAADFRTDGALEQVGRQLKVLDLMRLEQVVEES
jgi:CRP-like cAMP-binding protein